MIRLLFVLVLALGLGAPVAAQAPLSPSAPSIDQLIDKLSDLRVKRTDLDRQERDVVGTLREKIREQQQRLQQLGVQLDGLPPSLPITPTLPLAPADPLLAAYQVDRAQGLGGPAELRVLATKLRNAAAGLGERAFSVGVMRHALEVTLPVELRGKLPSTFLAVKDALAKGFPPDATAITREVAISLSLTLNSIATQLEKLTVL